MNQIRNEQQYAHEDVSHFVERLRKLIAQGRSEYPNDKKFETEAIRTLRNSVRNELISVKLMDSKVGRFEELADIAITRDSDLHERIYKAKSENSSTKDILSELLEKIKTMEMSQTATIQHIRESNYRSRSPSRFHRSPSRSPQRYDVICYYCRKPGHVMAECFKRFLKVQNDGKASGLYSQEFQNSIKPQGIPQEHDYQYANSISKGSQPPQSPYTYHDYQNKKSNFSNFEQQDFQDTKQLSCVRCFQVGHKARDCYAILCSNCKQIGHSYKDCPQNKRRVHFVTCKNCDETIDYDSSSGNCNVTSPAQGN